VQEQVQEQEQSDLAPVNLRSSLLILLPPRTAALLA
jgi:hypothetical protein